MSDDRLTQNQVLMGAMPALHRTAGISGEGSPAFYINLLRHWLTPPAARTGPWADPETIHKFVCAATAHVEDDHELRCLEIILHGGHPENFTLAPSMYPHSS